MLSEAIATAYRSASREAHRNGTTAPDWNTAAPLIRHQLSRALTNGAFTMSTDDKGADLITHPDDSGTAAYQIKIRGNPPGSSPALPAQASAPPPRPTPAARAS
ncbi:hypothetical protein [Streptomyces prasinus]|uniref:hypothetical protein n=1 Tax=Streptomyces prasinus TaxID=67345 RepID=UPI0033ABD9A5